MPFNYDDFFGDNAHGLQNRETLRQLENSLSSQNVRYGNAAQTMMNKAFSLVNQQGGYISPLRMLMMNSNPSQTYDAAQLWDVSSNLDRGNDQTFNQDVLSNFLADKAFRTGSGASSQQDLNKVFGSNLANNHSLAAQWLTNRMGEGVTGALPNELARLMSSGNLPTSSLIGNALRERQANTMAGQIPGGWNDPTSLEVGRETYGYQLPAATPAFDASKYYGRVDGAYSDVNNTKFKDALEATNPGAAGKLNAEYPGWLASVSNDSIINVFRKIKDYWLSQNGNDPLTQRAYEFFNREGRWPIGFEATTGVSMLATGAAGSGPSLMSARAI